MFITSPDLSGLKNIRHGFFTRKDGVSKGIYNALNCGRGSNDSPESVAENRRRVQEALLPTTKGLITLYQVHSPTIVTVAAPWVQEGAPRADAMVTRTPGIILGILTADCGPVLLADAEAGVIGAAHAGWKGALGGVIRNVVDAMTLLGAKHSRIAAAIGPCIAQNSYQVGPEFLKTFISTNPAHNRFFQPSTRDSHSFFDLEAFIHHQLAEAGIENVHPMSRDTYSEETEFFSYRRATHRNEPDYGRQISAISIRE